MASIDIIVKVIDAATAPLKRIGGLTRQLEREMLGMGLSFLFTGMAIKRLTDSALRSITQAYGTIMGQTSEFGILTNQLSANWVYFKWTLMDALMQSGLLHTFISLAISLLETLSSLPPEVKTSIVVGLVGVSALAGLAMIVGQIGLGFLGLSAAASMFGVSVTTALAVIFVPLFLILGAVVAIAAIWNTEWESGRKIMASIATVLGAVGIGMLVLGGAALAPFALLILVFAGLISLVVMFWDELKAGIQNVGFALRGMAIVFKDAFFSALQWIVDKVNKVIDAFNRASAFIGGPSISRISISGGDTSKDWLRLNQDVSAASATRQQNNNITVNVEGSADESTVEKIVREVQQYLARMSGSTMNV